jgi:hypothetical protein
LSREDIARHYHGLRNFRIVSFTDSLRVQVPAPPIQDQARSKQRSEAISLGVFQQESPIAQIFVGRQTTASVSCFPTIEIAVQAGVLNTFLGIFLAFTFYAV